MQSIKFIYCEVWTSQSMSTSPPLTFLSVYFPLEMPWGPRPTLIAACLVAPAGLSTTAPVGNLAWCSWCPVIVSVTDGPKLVGTHFDVDWGPTPPHHYWRIVFLIIPTIDHHTHAPDEWRISHETRRANWCVVFNQLHPDPKLFMEIVPLQAKVRPQVLQALPRNYNHIQSNSGWTLGNLFMVYSWFCIIICTILFLPCLNLYQWSHLRHVYCQFMVNYMYPNAYPFLWY